MAHDSGLVKRGLVVFGVLLVLVAAITYFMLHRPEAPASKPLPRPEPYLAALMVPSAAFPGSVNWGGLSQLGGKLPSSPGWQIRYTATRVLAQRGSAKLPLATLREMLDDEQQRLNHRVQLKDSRVVPNESDVQQVLLNGLKSVHEWHKHSGAVKAVASQDPELQQVYAAVAKLTEHPNQVIRTEALKVRLAIQAK